MESYTTFIDPRDFPSVEVVASSLDVSLYDARILTTGTLPRILSIQLDKEASKDLTAGIVANGGHAVSCRTEALFSAPKDVATASLAPSDSGAWEVQRKDGQTIARETITLIVQARKVAEQSTTTEKSEKKLNVGMTLATGGIPIRKKVTHSETRVTGVTENLLLYLFDAKGVNPVAILNGERLDYQVLGQDQQPSTLGNFNVLCTQLEKRCSSASWNREMFQSKNVEQNARYASRAIDCGLELVTARMLQMLRIRFSG